MCTAVLLLVGGGWLLAPSALLAQTGTNPGGGTGSGGATVCPQLDGADQTVVSGASVTLPLEITSSGLITILNMHVQHDLAHLQLTGFTPGPALDSYVTTHGPMPCDVNMTFSGMLVLMVFPVPFDTNVHGTDLFSLSYLALPTATPVTTSVTVASLCGTALPPLVDITIVPAGSDQLVRGDVDVNGSCNLGDVITVLGYLFNSAPQLACMEAADLDDSSSVNMADAIILLQSIFGFGPALPETCETDTSGTSLGCAQSSCP